MESEAFQSPSGHQTRSKTSKRNGNHLDQMAGGESPSVEPNPVGRDVPPTSGAGSEGKGKSSRLSGRKRSSSFQLCPVCGVTIRPAELEQHFAFEVQQLDHLVRRGRIARDAQAAYASSKARDLGKETRQHQQHAKRKRRRSENGTSPRESDSDGECDLDAYMEYLNVKANREARERRKELMHNPAFKPDTMLCPVCFVPLTGSEVERSHHVEKCLAEQPSTAAASGGVGEPEDQVDIEGDGDGQRPEVWRDGEEEEEESFETYEWGGETRIRAVSLVQGGYQGLGFHTISTKKSRAEEEEDDDLDVDGDETVEFGPQQYSEEDVLARCMSRSSQDAEDVGYEDHVNHNLLIEGCLGVEEPAARGAAGANDLCTKHVGLPSSGVPMVVESLKARVRELEVLNGGDGRERLKCQICLGVYKQPLVSIQCWHVHCAECWLTTLASKKLCPQCQMITAPSQLRRIYL